MNTPLGKSHETAQEAKEPPEKGDTFSDFFKYFFRLVQKGSPPAFTLVDFKYSFVVCLILNESRSANYAFEKVS